MLALIVVSIVVALLVIMRESRLPVNLPNESLPENGEGDLPNGIIFEVDAMDFTNFEARWGIKSLSQETINDLCLKFSSGKVIQAEQIKAIIYIESNGDPLAEGRNKAGKAISFGIMQIQPKTAMGLLTVQEKSELEKPLTGSDLFEVELNIDLGSRFLDILRKKYEPSFSFAEWSQAYNLGEPSFDRGERNESYGAFVWNKTTRKKVRWNAEQLSDFFRREFV